MLFLKELTTIASLEKIDNINRQKTSNKSQTITNSDSPNSLLSDNSPGMHNGKATVAMLYLKIVWKLFV